LELLVIEVPSPSSGNRGDMCGATDGHDEANKRFLRLCRRV